MIAQGAVARTTRQLSDEVMVVHTDAAALLDLAIPLAAMGYNAVGVDSVNALSSGRRMAQRRPAAMILALDGGEDPAEIAAVAEIAPEMKLLFLVPRTPAREALARIADAHRSAILRNDESVAVVVATLIALLAGVPVRSTRGG